MVITHLVYLECQVCQWNDTWFLWAIPRCVRIVSQFPREAHYECLISKVRQGKRRSYGKQLEGFQWKVEKLKRKAANLGKKPMVFMRKPCSFFCPFRVFGNRPTASWMGIPEEVYIHLRQPRYRAWASGDADAEWGVEPQLIQTVMKWWSNGWMREIWWNLMKEHIWVTGRRFLTSPQKIANFMLLSSPFFFLTPLD